MLNQLDQTPLFDWRSIQIPTILTADEILDKVFKKAARKTEPGPTRIQSASDNINVTLKKFELSFPSLNNLHPFYRELADLTVGIDKMKKSLGALKWCRHSVLRVSRESIEKIRNVPGSKEQIEVLRGSYGRMSSLVHQISKDLVFLDSARRTLKAIPSVDLNKTIVVIAGFPNVGKSQLVKILSTGKPAVASYPFTTKKILLGHMELGRLGMILIDTPGLLDRPLEKRNPIEKQAIYAMEHLANLIIFLLDPSEECGFTMEQQESLMAELQQGFSRIPQWIMENKSDILERDSPNLSISCTEHKGIDTIKERLVEFVAVREKEVIRSRLF